MKRWQDLNEQQKDQAQKKQLERILSFILEGFVDTVPDEIRDLINQAVLEANQMHTPWFQAEYILGNETVKTYLTEWAIAVCEEALFPEDGEMIIQLDWSNP